MNIFIWFGDGAKHGTENRHNYKMHSIIIFTTTSKSILFEICSSIVWTQRRARWIKKWKFHIKPISYNGPNNKLEHMQRSTSVQKYFSLTFIHVYLYCLFVSSVLGHFKLSTFLERVSSNKMKIEKKNDLFILGSQLIGIENPPANMDWRPSQLFFV